MKENLIYLPCLALAVLLTTGCESSGIANRINEKSALYASLEPDQKAYISDGIVFPGDTAEMAYIALGKPASVDTKQKDDTIVEMWTYKKYYPSGQLADFLTKYSRTRNPNLLRPVNLEGGKQIGSGTNSGSGSPTGIGSGFGAHGSATGTAGTMQPLSLPDLPVYNLYVFVHENKIADVKIESIDKTTFMWLEEAIELEKANKLREVHK